MTEGTRRGFTLIELSIVLVIIGLIAGGVLVGRDLIEAATIRAQVTQIEKYNAAVNTFRTKYNYLPGDIPPDQASATGLFTRGGGYGDGNGDGYIDGINPTPTWPIVGGETVFFWTDLSAANLIDGSFTQSTDEPVNISTDQMTARIGLYLPAAKIGRGYITVYGDGEPNDAGTSYARENNYQLLEFQPPNSFVIFGEMHIAGGPLTPVQAANLDTKIDDGQPTSGTVTAMVTGVPSFPVPPDLSIRQFVISNGSLEPPYTDCVALGPPVAYNTADSSMANQDICSLRIKAGF